MRRITFFVCMSVAAGAALLAVSPAPAQEDCYRMVDITALGFIPSPFSITFGVNDQHQAVGAYMVGEEKHAFLWLPEAAYNLAAGFHDLHTLAGLGPDAESAGYEINNAGMAVGWGDINGEQHALVWEINDYDPPGPLPTIDLDDFIVLGPAAPTIQVPTVAWAINNAVPPVVVGDASGLTDCNCPPEDNVVGTTLGFKALLGSEVLNVLLPIFNPPICDVSSYGRDISSLAVGYSAGAGGGPCVGNGSCASSKDAVHYPGNVPGALTDFSPGGSEARGVNDSASIVGWGFENGVAPCQMSAVFWPTSSANPVNLNSLLPVGHQSRAEAISNPDQSGMMLVVGSNETTQHALRWQGSGQTWTVVDLNDKIVNQCGSGQIVVRQSHDVSNDGWIIALADFDPGPFFEAHAVILIPDQSCQVCCFADLDCNGIVGVSDLLALLAAWGPCLGCPADLDCDGTVGVPDLLLLLTAWGTCLANPPSEIPQTVEDCVEKFYPNDMEALIACIEAVGS